MSGAVTVERVPRLILAPYVATPEEVAERMLDLARVGPEDVVYDLGCGDGRLVIAAAKRGARGVGVDIEPHWIGQARANAEAAGVAGCVEFLLRDALDVDLAPATVVLLYLVEWSTRRLEPKLAAELRPGARVVSHSFSMGESAPARIERWADAGGTERTIRLWVVGEGEHLGAAAVVPERIGAMSAVGAGPLDLTDLAIGHFQPWIGSPFAVDLEPPWALALELVEASPLGAATQRPGATRAPFRLIFRGPTAPVHAQATLPLRHETLGRQEIFLVPVGPDGKGMLYEAIFT